MTLYIHLNREKQTHTDNSNGWQRCGAVKALSHLLWMGVEAFATLFFSTKVKHKLPYDIVIPLLLGMYLKETWTHAPRDIHSSVNYNSPKEETTEAHR